MEIIRNFRRDLLFFDYVMAVLVCGISVFGILMLRAVVRILPVYAALPGLQSLHVISGAVLMLIIAFIDYRFISRFFVPIYLLCVGLLAAVLVIGPDPITGTARWIFIILPGGIDISFQPSEFAKIFLTIALAGYINWCKNINNPIWFLLYIVLAAVPIAMVAVQPSFSASTVLLAIAVTILFIGGLYKRIIIGGMILALPAAVLLYIDIMRQSPIFITQILNERQWQRILTFLGLEAAPDADMQIRQSLFAIASGGLYGKGFMNNDTWVIHGHNDFIFAIAAEQFGFVGSVVLLGVICTVIIKCLLTAYRTECRLGKLIAAGVASKLLFEVFVNVGVVTALLPNTGMPFPFLSYGGTSMWVHMAAIGLVLNVGIIHNRESEM